MSKRSRWRISLGAMLAVPACVACFLAGWMLPPPSFSGKFRESKYKDVVASVISVEKTFPTVNLGYEGGVCQFDEVVIFRNEMVVAKGSVWHVTEWQSAILTEDAFRIRTGDRVAFLMPTIVNYVEPKESGIALKGIVMKVEGDLAAVNIGTDDLMRQSMVVKFKRISRIIGTGIVAKTENNMSVVRIDGSIDLKKGDIVVVPE